MTETTLGYAPEHTTPLGNTLNDELLRRRCRSSYGEYVKLANPGFYMTHMHKYVCDKVQAFLEARTNKAMDVLLLSIPPRHGKQAADSTPVLTTAGWKRHGDLQVGDYVYAPDGRAIRVRAIIPQSQPSSLAVTLTNGETIRVHPNHEWVVYDRTSHKWRTVETRWMVERLDGRRFMLPPVQNPSDGAYSIDESRVLYVQSITPCEPEHGQCITVDGGVYLIGRTMVPTHNSFMITETLASWYLGQDPQSNVILCGYEGTFAEGFSRRCRDKFNQYATDVFRVKSNPNVQGVAQWETSEGGRCRAAGLKGGITGFGADLFIIDDPIKNQESAESETILAKIHDEMGPSVQSRIHPGGKLIVIQTRWVENDVIGYIQKNWSEYIWADINLPCECEDPADDPLHRKKGESLMGPHLGDEDLPPRINNDNAWLQSKKRLVCAGEGERVWNALYQGHPSAQNGNLFHEDWWRLYRRKIGGAVEAGATNRVAPSPVGIEDFEYLCLSVDATFKKTDTSDRVAIELWGMAQNHAWLYRLINKRMGFVETLDRIKALVKEYPQIDQLIVEDKANGSAIIDSLRYFDGVPPIVAVNPLGGKYSRAQAVSPFVAAGSVHIPCDFTPAELQEIECDDGIQEGYNRFISQHSRFPYAKNDDMVDAQTQAMSRIIKLVTGEEPVPERHWVRFTKWYPDMWEDYERMNSAEQEEFIRTYGAPEEWADL